MKNKICIIGVYFGKLPNYFDFWLESAKRNIEIDFLVVTDQRVIEVKPNIKVLRFDLNSFKSLAQKKLKMKLSMNSPYKLCDYKEVYGIILDDYIKEYDYWGECDFDLIFGDLNSFFKQYQLYNYDKFLNRGHLTLYRNTKDVNNRYKCKGSKFGSYKEVFKSNLNWGFDETMGMNEIYKENNFLFMDEFIYADIDVNYTDFRNVERNNFLCKNYEQQIFYWQDGKIFKDYFDEKGILNKCEYAYIHLQKRKFPKVKLDFSKSYYITSSGFYEKNSITTIDIIDKYNRRDMTFKNTLLNGPFSKRDIRLLWIGRRYLNFKNITKRYFSKLKCVLLSIRNGTFLNKTLNKFQRFFRINNNVIKNLSKQDNHLTYLKDKYSDVIVNYTHDYSIKQTRSNKIWIFWYQGLENAPQIVQKCINTINKYKNDNEVIILDKDSYKHYVDLPDYIIEKFEKRIISFAHFSDILRISLLAKHGGIWIDSTVLLTDSLPDYIYNTDLFVFKELCLDRTAECPIIASSWLISSVSNHDIIVLTRDLLYAYWYKENRLIDYFTFHLFFHMAANRFKDEFNCIPTYPNTIPHVLFYEIFNDFNSKRFNEIKQLTSVHKLNKELTSDNTNRYTFFDYIVDNDI